MDVILFISIVVLLVTIGGWIYNRSGPGDVVRDPNVKNRRNNWVP